MRLLIVRHGIAEDAGPSGASARQDEKRALTSQGRSRMRKAAQGLAELMGDVDLIASSPLLRAAQTAQIISDAYNAAKLMEIAALSPRRPSSALLEWLNAQKGDSTIALVGHEPNLSTFLCWLLTGLEESFVDMKKGGAALVEIAHPLSPGRGKLLWLLKPSQLRRLR